MLNLKSIIPTFLLFIILGTSRLSPIVSRSANLIPPDPKVPSKDHLIFSKSMNTQKAINALVFDSQSNLWLGTDKGVVQWNPETNALNHYEKSAGLPSEPIVRLFIDDKKNIWAASNRGELLKFSENQWSVEYKGRMNGFPSRLIQDSQGALWVGFDQGPLTATVAYYDYQTWNEIKLDWTKAPAALSATPDGKIWVKIRECCESHSRMFPLDDPEFEINEENRPYRWGQPQITPDGSFWMAATWLGKNAITTQSGLARYDPLHNTWEAYTVSLKLLQELSIEPYNLFPAQLIQKNPGDFWMITYQGHLFHFDGHTWEGFPSPIQTSFSITDMAVAPDGAIWISTTDGLLLRFDGREWQIHEEIQKLLMKTSTLSP